MAAPQVEVRPEVQTDIVVGGPELLVVLGNLRLEFPALVHVLGPLGVMVVPDFFVTEVRVLDIGAHAGILTFRKPLVPGGSGIDGVRVFAVGKQIAGQLAFPCRNPPVVVRSRHVNLALRPAKRTPEMERKRVVDKVFDLHEFDSLVAVILL